MNHYEVLGVAQDATVEQIRTAYLKLARKWHPDKNFKKEDEATEKFQQIGAAYEVLSDPDKRRRYDLSLQRGGSGDDPSDDPGSDSDFSGSDESRSDDEAEQSDDDGDLLHDLREFYEEYTAMMGDRTEARMAEEARRLHWDGRGGGAPPFVRACSACYADADLLREIITHMVATPNVETYTDLFRCDATSLGTTSKPIRASKSRGARVYVYRHALLSDDADGEPLGYQTPDSRINGRAPFFVEVQVRSPAGKWHRVPVISFHAPYGQSSKQQAKQPTKVDDGRELPPLGRLRDEPLDEELLAMRAEAVQKLLELGIPDYTNGPTVPLKRFPDAVIAGDFNLDMLKETQSTSIHDAYQALRDNGFEEMARNTATTFRSVDTCLPVRGTEMPRAEPFWYSAAYDNIFVKHAELELCPVIARAVPRVAGVVDVLDVMTRHPEDFFGKLTEARIGNHENYHPTAKYPAAKDPQDETHGPRIRARNELARYRRCEDDRQRAFFLYRKYISDHLPVFVDFFVSRTNEDEDDLGATNTRLPRPARPLIGLRNEGHTCYVNAALQLMHAMGYAARFGDRLQALAALTEDADAQLAAELLRVLGRLTTQAKNGTYLSTSNKLPAQQTGPETIWLDGNTLAIRRDLRRRGLIDELIGVNEDSRSVFTLFRSMLIEHPEANLDSAFFRDHFRESDDVEPPVLPSHYHFILRATVDYERIREIAKPEQEPTTLDDEDRLIKYDAPDSLELAIPAADGLTLEKLADAYLRRDLRAEKNTEHNCRIDVEDEFGDMEDKYFLCKPTFERWELVGEAPAEIVVVLKRFEWSEGGAKINRKVVCNEAATILKREYQLRGFIYHEGELMAAGHYLAYVKHGGVWYELDDSRVTPNPPSLEERRDHAYVYWYVYEADPNDDKLFDELAGLIGGMKITD